MTLFWFPFHCHAYAMMLLCDCVCVCVSLSLKLTHSRPHTQNVKVLMIWCGRGWIHLYFLPSLREVSLTRMIVSLGRDFLRTPTVCTYIYHIQESVYVLCESGLSNTHARQLTLPSPFPVSLSLFPLSLSPYSQALLSWKVSRRGTNVTQMDLYSSAVGLTHWNKVRTCSKDECDDTCTTTDRRTHCKCTYAHRANTHIVGFC